MTSERLAFTPTSAGGSKRDQNIWSYSSDYMVNPAFDRSGMRVTHKALDPGLRRGMAGPRWGAPWASTRALGAPGEVFTVKPQ